MTNIATRSNNYTTGLFDIKVNGHTVYSLADEDVSTTITVRLNRIFSDPNRDLDFITPSYVDGHYVICCPKVRKNVGEVTYLVNGSVDMKIYENSIWVDDPDDPEDQTAILAISNDIPAPWHEALRITNNIRNYVRANFTPLHGASYIYRLQTPTNTSVNTANTLYTAVDCDMYGEICQGAENDDHYTCIHTDYYGGEAHLISTERTANNEIFHPMDLVAAVCESDYKRYKMKYVKIIYGNKSIVVRIVDVKPSVNSIELSFAAWQALGYPPCNNQNVSAILMGEPS